VFGKIIDTSSDSKVVDGISGGYFTDSRDGKKYKIVTIGGQTWMAENLNYNASGSKCYDNNPANCDKYGRLYDWPTAKVVCPHGWHLPNNKEWDALTTAVGGKQTAGKLLKAMSGWYNHNGTDAYGFAALPSGCGYSDGSFGGWGGVNSIGNYGYWWSISAYNADQAYDLYMTYKDDVANGGINYKSILISVRCLQD